MLRPERRSELVHRRCWAKPGPQLVWSGPGLVLVAAWLPRVTGVRSTVLPSHFWAALLGRLVLVLAHYFFYIMRKYAYRRRGYRGHKPSYTVNRKFCRNLTWNKLANDADIYTAAVQLVYNLVLSLAISLGLFLQLSTLKYSYKTYQLTMA